MEHECGWCGETYLPTPELYCCDFCGHLLESDAEEVAVSDFHNEEDVTWRVVSIPGTPTTRSVPHFG